MFQITFQPKAVSTTVTKRIDIWQVSDYTVVLQYMTCWNSSVEEQFIKLQRQS